jgi:hypothetical protein
VAGNIASATTAIRISLTRFSFAPPAAALTFHLY